MKRLLVQTQLSNIVNGKFDLACDSGWQMVINRIREMLRLNPDLHVDVMGPYWDPFGQCQLIAAPWQLHPDLFNDRRLNYVEHWVQPHALTTRFDFDWDNLAFQLRLDKHKLVPGMRYDAVYVNDPMQLRALKALFHVAGGYQPKFYVHSHFVDLPEVPKFPQDASLWLGQCEAALRADHNFWQCGSAMEQFFASMGKWFTQDVVDDVRAKSTPSDDGYSVAEITAPPDMSQLRFSPGVFYGQTIGAGKAVVFFPNRISQSSNDYTRGWWFVHDFLPRLRQRRQDFIVVCGNPNLKLSNDQLLQLCGPHGYVKLHDGTLNRDEYKWIARNSDIVVGLYDAQSDAYGGTASRECVELGCIPLWPDANEYSRLAREASYGHMLAKPDLSDLVDKADNLIGLGNAGSAQAVLKSYSEHLRAVVRRNCSYEQTVPAMMERMGIL